MLLTELRAAILCGLNLWAITGAAISAGAKALKMGSGTEQEEEQEWSKDEKKKK